MILSSHCSPVLAQAHATTKTKPRITVGDGHKRKKKKSAFWKILDKDREFMAKRLNMPWLSDARQVVADKMDDLFHMRAWENSSHALQHFPRKWPKPHYPGLKGRELVAADINAIKDYATYISGLFNQWNIPLSESYDPDKVADYFKLRPHVLVFRIIEVSMALVFVFTKSKIKQGVNPKGAEMEEELLEINPKGAEMEEELLEIDSKYTFGVILKEAMLNLGPTFVKVGQSLSTRPDLVGEEVAKALSELQDQLPPFPTEKAIQIIENELGGSVKDFYSFVSDEPVAAASFGQVYFGRIIKGEDVAIKVQRPHALYNVARDIYILRMSAGILGKLAGRKSDLRLYVDEIGQGLFGELDYSLEAKRALEFKEAHLKFPYIVVPKPFMYLTGKRVLTMEWISGRKPKDLILELRNISSDDDTDSTKQLEARNQLLSLVNKGVEACLVQLLETGLLHADPHPGNLVFTPTGQLGFLDFGLLCRMEKRHQIAMLSSIVHIANADWNALVFDLAEMDIIRPETHIQKVQMELQLSLDDATTNDGIPDVKFSKVLTKILTIAVKFHFKMPPYYTLVLRSVASFEGLALAIDPNFKTFEAAYPYVANRLLFDNSIQMRKILHSLIFNERKEVEWSKLSAFTKMAKGYAKTTSKSRQSQANPVHYLLSESHSDNVADWAYLVLKLLSSKDGAVLRRLLITADTAYLANKFISKDSAKFRRSLVLVLSGMLYEQALEVLRERNILSLKATTDYSDKMLKMEHGNSDLLKTCKKCWRDLRVKVIVKTALTRLKKAPILTIKFFLSVGLVIFSSAALAAHQLFVKLCHLYVRPTSVNKYRSVSFQT